MGTVTTARIYPPSAPTPRPTPEPAVAATTAGPAHPSPRFRVPRFLLLAITAASALSSSTTPPELTAAQAANRLGQYVHVRATVVRAHTARTGYTFLNLDHPRPGCKLEVVIKA